MKGLPVREKQVPERERAPETSSYFLLLDLGTGKRYLDDKEEKQVHVLEVRRHFSEGIWGHWVALGHRHVQIWALQGHSGYSEANEYHSVIRKNKILPFAVHGWTGRALS